jgi:hypothetical protein
MPTFPGEISTPKGVPAACQSDVPPPWNVLEVPGVKALIVGSLIGMGNSTYGDAARDPNMIDAVSAAAKAGGKDPWVRYCRALAATDALEKTLPDAALHEIDSLKIHVPSSKDRRGAATAARINTAGPADAAAGSPIAGIDAACQTLDGDAVATTLPAPYLHSNLAQQWLAALGRAAAPPNLPNYLGMQSQQLEALRWFMYVLVAWRPAWVLEMLADRYDQIFYFFCGKAGDAAADFTHTASPIGTDGKVNPFGCTLLVVLVFIGMRPKPAAATAMAGSCVIL